MRLRRCLQRRLGAVRKLGNRDALFDLGADFAGRVVPDGTIVVKLIDKPSKKHSA